MTNTESTGKCREQLDSAVLALRLGMEGMAGERMARFVNILEPRLAWAPPDEIQRLTPLLTEALAAQARGDFIRLADLLQYEIRSLV